MSVKLKADDASLASLLADIEKDGSTSPIEMQQLCEAARLHAEQAMHADIHIGEKELRRTLARILATAEDLVDNMQRVAFEVRFSDMPDNKRRNVKSAIEHQIAYVIGGYRATFQQL